MLTTRLDLTSTNSLKKKSAASKVAPQRFDHKNWLPVSAEGDERRVNAIREALGNLLISTSSK